MPKESLFSSYRMQPESLMHQMQAMGLSVFEQMVFRHLMDLCWLDSPQDRMVYDPASLSDLLDMDITQMEAVINRLTDPGQSLCQLYLDMESDRDQMCISINYLTDELNRQKKQMQFERRQRATTEANQSNQVNTRDLVRFGITGADAVIDHKSVPSLDECQYDGWMPTRRFDQSGEVYNVRPCIKDVVQRYYPSVDIDAELSSMFHWLCDNPDRRPTAGQMNRFITRWVERRFSGFEKSHKSGSSRSIDDAMDALDAMFGNDDQSEVSTL